MSRDEIREIAEIVGTDRAYVHFVHRINKEFEKSDEERNSKVYVLFEENEAGQKVGFCVIGHSPAKMRVWEKTFKEEGWVGEDFTIKNPAFELMYLYVKPSNRRRGYGGQLFTKALDFSAKQGVEAIYAYVSDQDGSAMQFYKDANAKLISDFSEEGINTAFLQWDLQQNMS